MDSMEVIANNAISFGDPIWTFVATLVGAVVGASASIIATWRTNKSNAVLAKEARAEEASAIKRRFNFENTVQLQEAALHLAQWNVAAYLELRSLYHEGVSFLDARISDDVAYKQREAEEQFFLYCSRLVDDDLRKMCDELRDASRVLLVGAESEKDLIEAFDCFLKAHEIVMEEIGASIREHQKEK